MTRPASRFPISCCTSRLTPRRRSSSPGRISAAARPASTRPGRCSISASRCIVAPCFADIFYNNCFKNGILPITLPQAEIDKLIDDASRGANAVLHVDLPRRRRSGAPTAAKIQFDIDPFRKRCLMEGLDDIGLTLEKADAIEAFEGRIARRAPLGLTLVQDWRSPLFSKKKRSISREASGPRGSV